jgi:hypothetical protein
VSLPTEEEEGAVPMPDGEEPAVEEAAPRNSELESPVLSPQSPVPSSSSALDRPRAREAVVKAARGYTLRLEPPDLARLRELPGARGRSDEELGEEFLAGHCDRFVSALSGDVAAPATIRVVVDPWSRQAFLALEKTIRAIVSF